MLASELPVYKDTYDLVSMLIDYVNVFPKAYKHNIGSKIISESLELFESLQLANRYYGNSEARSKHLDNFLIKFELLKVLLRLCNDKKIISIKQTAQLALFYEKIGKQVNGWKNS